MCFSALTPISLPDIRLEVRRMPFSIPHPAIRASGCSFFEAILSYMGTVHSHMSTFGIHNQFSFYLTWPFAICISFFLLSFSGGTNLSPRSLSFILQPLVCNWNCSSLSCWLVMNGNFSTFYVRVIGAHRKKGNVSWAYSRKIYHVLRKRNPVSTCCTCHSCYM